MNDCWKILGIEPTDNKREIRSAYAAQSKQYHMEENPEEFARLNQAYQEALEYAKTLTANAPKHQEEYNSKIPKILNKNEEQSKQAEEKKKLEDQTKQANRKEPESSDSTKDQDQAPSLLQRIQQAEETQVEESIAKGALKNFIAIFEKAKETGKVPKADVWKTFFLSEEFLKEQYEEGFAKGMLQYLSKWSMEGNYQIYTLPFPFLMELAIAYGLQPERVNHFPSNKIRYQVNANGSFYGRECAAKLWNMQKGSDYFPIRIFNKPENLVRLYSFIDYLRLRTMNQNHLLTPENQNNWERILMSGRINHMYERNGKGVHDIYEETRSVCLISLYIFWVQNDEVPPCILEYMYKEYDLKTVERSSAKNLYGPLKQEILKKYPDIELILFGAESRIQMESQWYKELTKIISDNHTNYDKGIYQETEEIKERIQKLFARSEWQKIQNSQSLFQKMYLQLYNRMVVPESLAKRLLDFYTQKQSADSMEKWAEPQKISILIETLIQSMAFNRRIRDTNGLLPLGEGKTGIEDINNDNRDFWYYYLMVGYGFRKADIDLGADSQVERKYALGSNCYLPLYIQYTYYPSQQWCKQFVGYKDGRTDNPTAIEFQLPDKKRLKVEFHLHYCLYFLDGKQVFQPEYTFGQFVEFADQLEKTEQFFFLLAITEIGEENWTMAQALIEERLSKLVLYPFTIPMLTRLLAEGREEMVQHSDYDGEFRYYKKAAPMNHTRTRKARTEARDLEAIEAIYYMEQESMCFRMLVTDKTIRLYHQRQYGWHEMPLNGLFEISENQSLEERKTWARMALKQLKKPQPVSLGVFSLEGMENEEKAEKIMESLQKYEEYRRREQDWSPCPPSSQTESDQKARAFYYPGYPWYRVEAGSVLEQFFQKEGRFLTESYCIIRFGPDKKEERLLYCGVSPYCLQENEQNPNFASSYQFSLRELERKIKEKHWILGNFGWGDAYSYRKEFEPSPFALGESGTYYNFDVFRMYRTDSLTTLLAKRFDFTNATEVEIYQGCLAFSCLNNNQLEYCYGEEALRASLYSPNQTAAELFVRFTQTGRKQEFSRWANEILARVDRLGLPLFVMEQHKENVYSLALYDRKEFDFGHRSARMENLMGETKRLFWKTDGSWNSKRMEELGELVLWYMDHGTYGWKLKNCLKVEAAEFTLDHLASERPEASLRLEAHANAENQNVYYDSALQLALCESGHTPDTMTRSDSSIYMNLNALFKAMTEQLSMTAYSLTVDEKGTPDLFDSKIGGLPYWEPEKEYPKDTNGKKLVLLVQINLDRNPMEMFIPGGGMLQFYGAADEIFSKGFGSHENQEQYRVVYHKQVDYHISKERLIELGLPDSTKCYPVHTPVSKEQLLKAEEVSVSMGIEDYRFLGTLKNVIEETFGLKVGRIQNLFDNGIDGELFEDEESFLDVDNAGFWLLGYPAFASNQKDPRENNKELRKYDRLLFQFDVHYLEDSYYLDSEHGCGIANFFIQSEDLAKQDFSRVMYNWECCKDEDDWDEDEEDCYNEDWDEDEEDWDEED